MRTNYPKRCMLLALALLLALYGFGCGRPKPPEPVDKPVILSTPTPEPRPVAGGELYLPIPTNADVTDPLAVTTEEMLFMFSLIYEGLVRLDASSQITACLAENWSSDEGGKVWTFKLRPAKWHNTNERLNAADVVYTYERILALGSSCYYAYHVSKIDSMRAVDENTLEITMKQPGIPPLYSLTFPIMKSGSVGADTPVGTGPYKVSAIGGGRVSLVINENWWKQAPYIEKVTFLARDNNETALASYAAGQLNMVPTSLVSVGKYREEGVTTVLDVMTQTAEMLLVNNNNNRNLADVRVRKAIAYAIERSGIISNIYMNRAQACDVPVAPDSWLYEPKSKIYDYDAAKSKALLEEAGWTDIDGDGVLEHNGVNSDELSLTLLVCDTTDGLRKAAAGLIAEQLKKVGIDTQVVLASYALGESNSEFVRKLSAGEFDLALVGFTLSRDADLSALFNASGSSNFGRINDKALEKLISNINTAANESEYRSAASAFQMYFAEELPCIMLYFRLNSIVYASRIRGLNASEVREPDILRGIEKWYMAVEEH